MKDPSVLHAAYLAYFNKKNQYEQTHQQRYDDYVREALQAPSSPASLVNELMSVVCGVIAFNEYRKHTLERVIHAFERGGRPRALPLLRLLARDAAVRHQAAAAASMRCCIADVPVGPYAHSWVFDAEPDVVYYSSTHFYRLLRALYLVAHYPKYLEHKTNEKRGPVDTKSEKIIFEDALCRLLLVRHAQDGGDLITAGSESNRSVEPSPAAAAAAANEG
jgi:hypothetical protein